MDVVRLGRWQYGRLGAPYEVKLVVRSEAVDDVYVHYITQLNPQWSAADVLYLHPKQAALLHYKALTPHTHPLTHSLLLF